METLPDLLRFVWLSRGDLPAGMNPATPAGRRAFLLWWVFHGRHEFPLVAPLVPPDALASLFLPGPDGVPPLAAALWRERSDLRGEYAGNDPRLAAWLFVHGVDEFGLRPLVGPRVRDWLRQPVGPALLFRVVALLAGLRADLAGLDGNGLAEWWLFHGRDENPGLAAWLEPDDYAPLFLPGPDGVPPPALLRLLRGPDEFGLRALVGPRVRDWLRQPVGPAGPFRVVALLAGLRADLDGLDGSRLAEWWLLHGRHEHPGLAAWLEPDDYAPLFLPGPDGVPPPALLRLLRGPDEFGLRALVGPRVRDWLRQPVGPAGPFRVVALLAGLRADLDGLDGSGLAEWWLLHGRHEHPDLAAWLEPDDYAPLLLPGPDGVPPPALLRLLRGPDEFGLRALVGPRVRDWLRQPVGPAGPFRVVALLAGLRADLDGLDGSALAEWWLLHGRHEHPDLAAWLEPDDYAPLFLPGPDGVPPMARVLWRRRADLRGEYADDDPRLAVWLFVHGLDEHDLRALVGPRVRDWLCQPVGAAGLFRMVTLLAGWRADLAGLDGTALLDWFLFHGLREHGSMPLLTDEARAELGIRFVDAMRSCRSDVPSGLPAGVSPAWWPAPPGAGAPLCRALLADPRRGLVAWCLNFGLAEYGLADLPGDGDRAFLAIAPPEGAGLSPAMALAWYGRADLRADYDPATPEGRAGLARWYHDRGGAELPLAGLVVPAPSLPRVASVLRGRRPRGVNLVGFARGELGIGEDVRCMALALEAAGIPHTIVSLETRSNCRGADRSMDGRIGDRPLYDTNVFCLTGFDTVWAYVKLGPGFFAGALNIGNWPWELPAWPSSWAFALDLVDEVWGISRFCADCYAAATSKPVLWMPSAIRPPAPPPLGRTALGLPEGRFLFAVVFDFNSFIARKNPLAALEAFERAFGAGGAPVLAVKVMNADAADPRWQAFRRRAEANPSVILLEGTWPYDRVIGLVAAADCLLSLHRAEGLGRGLAEAMALGVPVIATGWSGSRDLTGHGRALEVEHRLVPVPAGAYPCAEGQVWADPSIDHAARCMRRVAATGAAAMAEKARDHVLAHHSLEAAGARYSRRLQELWAR